jgi:hypothetical protein
MSAMCYVLLQDNIKVRKDSDELRRIIGKQMYTHNLQQSENTFSSTSGNSTLTGKSGKKLPEKKKIQFSYGYC